VSGVTLAAWVVVAVFAGLLVAAAISAFDDRQTRKRDELVARRRARADQLEQERRRARLDVKERGR
jgi:type II secretory pathway pseudopilin PulG